MKTILNLKSGESGVVKAFSDDALSSKFMTMGIVPDSTITVVRKAPFGGALYLKSDGHSVAVRNSEAAAIVIEG